MTLGHTAGMGRYGEGYLQGLPPSPDCIPHPWSGLSGFLFPSDCGIYIACDHPLERWVLGSRRARAESPPRPKEPRLAGTSVRVTLHVWVPYPALPGFLALKDRLQWERWRP